MRKHSILDWDYVLSFFIKVFIFVNLFTPYVVKINYRNCTFILSNFIALLIIVLLLRRDSINKNKFFVIIFSCVLLIYNLIATSNNIQYNHYFIEQFNKDISFLLFIFLIYKIDKEFVEKHNIIKFLITCITLTLLASCVFHFLGGNTVIIENSSIGFSKIDNDFENRLTWTYGHKSVYAVMLILFLSVILKNKEKFNSKKLFYFILILIVFTSILTASATLLILLFLVLGSYYFKNFNYKKNIGFTMVIIPILIVAFVYSFSIVMNYVGQNRNLSTFGYRTYIYEAAMYNLKFYPHGVGKQFGEFYMNAQALQVENFHNIFLNEMLRFSVPVGVLYVLLFLVASIYSIKKSGFFAFGIWISCYILFCTDYSLRTEQLSLFLFLIFITTIYDDKTKSIIDEKSENIQL